MEYGTLTVTPRELTLTLKNVTMSASELDGKPLTGELEAIPEGALAAGDRLVDVRFDVSLSEPGKKQYGILSYRILNADGEDVTANYIVKTQKGWLTLTP